MFTGNSDKKSSSGSSKLSVVKIQNILESLKADHNRESTKRNYLSIWRSFNSFLIRLDARPKTWEARTALFLAYLIQQGIQSSTIKSYKSAIKGVLVDDGYQWNDDAILLHSLTRACRLRNDRIKTCLPIQGNLLELIVFEIQRLFNTQFYLCVLYKAIFMLGFYGLFRVGKLTSGSHPIKAKDVHVAVNKDKILIVLYSSKTHNKADRPQKIKIQGNSEFNNHELKLRRKFCPFKEVREYLQLRGDYGNDQEPFFIFRDGNAVKPYHTRIVLKQCLNALGLNSALYRMHSLRVGRSTELVTKLHYSLSELKRVGRWRSNVVYKYLRD